MYKRLQYLRDLLLGNGVQLNAIVPEYFFVVVVWPKLGSICLQYNSSMTCNVPFMFIPADVTEFV